MDQVRVPLIDTSSFSTPHSIQTSQDCAFFLLCCWDFYMCHVMVARPSHHLANSSIFVILTFWMSVDLRKEVSQKKAHSLWGGLGNQKATETQKKTYHHCQRRKSEQTTERGLGRFLEAKVLKKNLFTEPARELCDGNGPGRATGAQDVCRWDRRAEHI